MQKLRYWAIAFVPATASFAQTGPVMLGDLDHWLLINPLAQIRVELEYSIPYIRWQVGIWPPGFQGTVDIPVPREFADELTDCSNESLYVNGVGKMEGPHPRLATWGLGLPDLGGADIQFLRLRIYNSVNLDFQFWGYRACAADCDLNCTLDIFDFLCFQESFVTGQSYACDCDPDPVCDIFDFLCFQDAFVRGCP